MSLFKTALNFTGIPQMIAGVKNKNIGQAASGAFRFSAVIGTGGAAGVAASVVGEQVVDQVVPAAEEVAAPLTTPAVPADQLPPLPNRY